MTRLIARALAVALLALGLPLAAGAAPASAAVTWLDGLFAQSTITSCTGIIWGSPYQETGMITYVGYEGDLSAQAPKPVVGDTFYVHVVAGAAGNACAGQFVQPSLELPAGLVAAATAGTPVKCYYKGSPLGCNASYSGGRYYWTQVGGSTPGSSIWGVPLGTTVEFLLPVRASTQVVGTLQAYIPVADGNSSPTLTPRQSILVLPASGAGVVQPVVSYPSPSTQITPGVSSSHRSLANVVTGQSGYVVFDLGTAAGVYTLFHTTPYAIGAGSNQLVSAWGGLTPGTTYHWRMCFRLTAYGSNAACGSNQSFTAIANDGVAPTVSAITLLGPNAGTFGDPVTGPTVAFRVTFSEPVTLGPTSLDTTASGSLTDLAYPDSSYFTVSPSSGLAQQFVVTMRTGIGTGSRGVAVFANGSVRDAAGNALAGSTVSQSARVDHPTADVGAPAVSVSALPGASLGSAVSASWTASDNVGLGYFAVQSRSVSLAGVAGAWSSPGKVVGPAVRSAAVSLAAGSTRCVRVLASDTSGNRSTSASTCTSTPADDRVARTSGTWTNVASTAAFRGTLSKSVQAGATKYLTGVKAKKVIVVVQKGPGAGSIEVRVNGVSRGTYPLASATTRSRQVITVTLPTVVTGATVTVRVASAGSTGVRIDGLGVSPT